MTPVVPATPDSAASLVTLQESVNNLRRALNQCAVRQSQLQKTNQLASNDTKTELQTLSRHLLSQTIAIKLAHESIIQHVDTSRHKIRNDQQQLINTRLKLQNLEYEKRTLQSEISKCRATASPSLVKSAVTIPSALFDPNEPDEAVSRHLKAANTALQDELVARKKAQAQVEAALQETDAKRRELAEIRTALRKVPNAVRAIANVVEPIQNLVTTDRNGISSNDVLAHLGRLPSPLYVLAREAIAYREAFDHSVNLTVATEEDSGEITERLYTACRETVVLEMTAPDVPARLRLQFRYLEQLGIVVVRPAVFVDGNQCDEYPTKELRLLFPHDCGDVSPRAGNAHLQNGTFVFDVAKAGGRAFLWANVMCGIACLPGLGSGEAEVGRGSAWVKEMWGLMTHMRFKEVVNALQKRLVTVVKLKEQVDSLMAKNTCVRGSDIGVGAEPCATVEDFVKLGRGDWNPEGLVREGDDGRDTEVWSMHVVGMEGFELDCLVAIEADYPQARPMFRVGCEKVPYGICEMDVVDIERCVNGFQVEGKLKGQPEVLLGAQITALLVFVDRLEEACKTANGEVVEDAATSSAKGRLRSKRDLLLNR